MAPQVHHEDVIEVHVEGAATAQIAPEGAAESGGTGQTDREEEQRTVDGADHAVAIGGMAPRLEQEQLTGSEHEKECIGPHAAKQAAQALLMTAHPHAEQQKGKGHGEEIATVPDGQLDKGIVHADQQGDQKEQGQQAQTAVHPPQTDAAPQQQQGLEIGREVPEHAVVGIAQQELGPEIAGKEQARETDRAVVLPGEKLGIEIVVEQIDGGGEQTDAQDAEQRATQLVGGGLPARKKKITGDHEEDGTARRVTGASMGLA